MWNIFGEGAICLTDERTPDADFSIKEFFQGAIAPNVATDAWVEHALCSQTDPESFFPEKGGSAREAKAICSRCTVRDRCLEEALKRDDRFGIWGGLSERERREMRHRRSVG